MSKNTGFFAQLLKRRIPQFFGIYLAGSWTILEFTQWAVGRYSLSPNWEEAFVVALLVCLPLVLVLAWHHGAPGRQKWSIFEKVFIPLNILAVPLVLHTLYKDSDFGKTVEMVMVADQQGKQQEREVPKVEYIKPLMIFAFSNSENDPKLDILGAISAEALRRDMSQNQFYSLMDFFQINDDIKRTSLPFNKLPLSLQIKMAKERAREYFINGKISIVKDNYNIKANIYSAKSGKKLFSTQISNKNLFSIIDKLTLEINNELFPILSEYTDLPIEDLYTSNWQAFEQYANAKIMGNFSEDGPDKVVPYYAKAIELDPTFSQAAFSYALFVINQQKLVEAGQYTKLAQTAQSYRLTESEQFSLTALNYFITKRQKESFQTIDQWITLYPTDPNPHAMRAMYSRISFDFDSMINSYKKVIELDPSRHALWDQIGDAYTSQGKYELAEQAYNEFIKMNPNKPLAYKNLGDFYRQTANIDKSISNYQKALALNPNDNNVLINLALTLARQGQFKEAEDLYLQAMANASTANEEFISENRLANLYWEYGKRQDSVRHYRNSFKVLSEKVSKVRALQNESTEAWRYYLAGEIELAENTIAEAYALAAENNEEIYLINVQAGQALLLNQSGKAEQALPLYENILKTARAYLASGNDAQINFLKGQTYFALGEYQKALDLFAVINNKFPDQLQFMEWSAKTLLQLGKFSDAKQLYQQILNIAPGYPEYNYFMAKVELGLQNSQSAKTYLQKALKSWEVADTAFDQIIDAQQLLSKL